MMKHFNKVVDRYWQSFEDDTRLVLTEVTDDGAQIFVVLVKDEQKGGITLGIITTKEGKTIPVYGWWNSNIQVLQRYIPGEYEEAELRVTGFKNLYSKVLLKVCPDCHGDGFVGGRLGGHDEDHRILSSKCPTCGGTGYDKN